MKWELHRYVLCASTNGYICAFEPYFEKITTQPTPNSLKNKHAPHRRGEQQVEGESDTTAKSHRKIQ